MASPSPKQAHTATCFDAVLEVASENNNVIVVNGWLFNGRQWILHAWCETDKAVIDLTETHETIDKATYYQIMGITPERTVRYTRLAFFSQVAYHGHFGPFDTDFFFATMTSQDPLTCVQSS
jgi:hypothetical protein